MHLQHLILDSKATATRDEKVAALKTLRVVVKNLADPQKNSDPKYRQLKLSNEKVKAKLSPCPSALDYMKALGFSVVIEEDGEEYLRILSSKTISASDMEASLAELNNAIDMLVPKEASFAEEKKTPITLSNKKYHRIATQDLVCAMDWQLVVAFGWGLSAVKSTEVNEDGVEVETEENQMPIHLRRRKAAP